MKTETILYLAIAGLALYVVYKVVAPAINAGNGIASGYMAVQQSLTGANNAFDGVASANFPY